ncbi:MAG: HEAT repeat domain-containing protein [Chlamydiota bacterium]|nr:HEAT repeat domain-containing protein [Chlamydiota bacterium]
MQADQAKELAKRVRAHVLIEDYRSACLEGRRAIKKYPQSKELIESYIYATAKAGDEQEMFQAWKYYCGLCEEPHKNREVLEVMGWSIIDKGSKSASPLVRIMALLGAYFGQDARGVRIIHRSLRDYDAMVRDVALQVSSSLRDDRLKKEVLDILRSEQSWPVRMSAIRTIGKMKVKEALPDLMRMLEGPRSVYEVRMAALQAIAEIEDDVSREKLVMLASSPKIGFRQLACQLCVAFQRESDIDVVIPLIKDSNSDVRAAALYAIGMIRPLDYNGKPISDLITPALTDTNEVVAITASWLMTLYDRDQGYRNFSKWLRNPNKNTRIFASSALKATGHYGQPFLYEAFSSAKDPYVRMNLALALITQRSHVEEASDALHHHVINADERLMWRELLHFKAIAPSTIKHNPSVPHLPEATDQMVRLEVFNALAIVKDAQALEAIRKFLEERNWGITAAASAMLLMEGDDNSIALVEQLLEDPNPKIRIQSALMLALWGEGEKAAAVLQESYAEADRNLKERILEGLGQIRTKETIPFLTDKLGEQHPTLRIIAAAALLKAMYN